MAIDLKKTSTFKFIQEVCSHYTKMPFFKIGEKTLRKYLSSSLVALIRTNVDVKGRYPVVPTEFKYTCWKVLGWKDGPFQTTWI